MSPLDRFLYRGIVAISVFVAFFYASPINAVDTPAGNPVCIPQHIIHDEWTDHPHLAERAMEIINSRDSGDVHRTIEVLNAGVYLERYDAALTLVEICEKGTPEQRLSVAEIGETTKDPQLALLTYRLKHGTLQPAEVAEYRSLSQFEYPLLAYLEYLRAQRMLTSLEKKVYDHIRVANGHIESTEQGM